MKSKRNTIATVSIIVFIIALVTGATIWFFNAVADKVFTHTGDWQELADAPSSVMLSELDLNWSNGDVIGYMSSDDFDLDCNIVYGTSSFDLNFGAGLHTDSSLPGSITPAMFAGHCQYRFNGFQNAEVGDVITVKMSYGVFKYRISKIEIVNANSFDATTLNSKEYQALFYTCYPYNATPNAKSQRQFFYCKQIAGTKLFNDVTGYGGQLTRPASHNLSEYAS